MSLGACMPTSQIRHCLDFPHLRHYNKYQMKAPNPSSMHVRAPLSDLSPLNLFAELWQLFGGSVNRRIPIETFCRKSLMELSRFGGKLG